MRGFLMGVAAAWFIHFIICALLGWLASGIAGRPANEPVWKNMVLGIAGAWIAGMVFKGGLLSQQPSLIALGVAFVGALIVCFAFRWLEKR